MYLEESNLERSHYDIILIPNVESKNQFINLVDEGKELVFLVFGSLGLRFEYGAVVGGFNSERYLQLLQWQAHLAQQRLEQTGKITVIIQDGGSFHRSKKVKTLLATLATTRFVHFFPATLLA